MRRGGMRLGFRGRLAAGSVLMAMLAAAACQGRPAAVGAPTSTLPSASRSASPGSTRSPLAPDPLVTAEVCSIALAATDRTIELFLEKSAEQELAAAQNDNAAIVAAAEAIDERFVSLAETFTRQGARAVDPGLRDRLTRTATALTEMSSDFYTGSTVDTHVKLVEFQSGLGETCSSLVGPTPTAAG